MRRLIFLWLVLPACLLGPGAVAQSDPRQAVCQASWERCLGSGGDGKNWKPIYDRCMKARVACLGGRAYLPTVPQNFSSGAILEQGAGASADPANADPATQDAQCQNGGRRGARSNCVLAMAGEGYGQSFSLLGPGVPMARIQRVSSVVKCAGGKPASFYSNGRIESCTLDNSGMATVALTDTSGKTANCAARAVVRFDPEGRLAACDRP